MKGTLIAFEGLDASGKSTQLSLLKERLEQEGYAVTVFKFPSYEKTYYGRLLQRYLAGEFGNVGQVSPYLIGVIYALDRLEMRPAIIKALDAGKIVLLDRYVASNKAHMGAKLKQEEQQKFLQWVDELDFEKNKMPREDVTLFLEVPVAITLQLMQQNNKLKDIHERDSSYMEEVWKLYHKLAQGMGWVTVPCVEHSRMLGREVIADRIYAALKEKNILK